MTVSSPRVLTPRCPSSTIPTARDAAFGGPPEVLKFYYYCRVNADLKQYNVRYSLLQIPYGAYKRQAGEKIINLARGN
jgi:hypothetical protein